MNKRIFFSLLFATSLLVGCDELGNEKSSSSGAAGLLNVLDAPEEDIKFEYSEEVEPEMADVSATQEQKIIKTARLAFESQKLEETHQNILQLSNRHKGFVQSDNSSKNYNRTYRNMVIRVPTEHFQDFINGVSEAVEYFDQREISRQDVTEEFVDIQARLSAKKELEKRYLELLKSAKNVKEMLEIERELSNIREEIEAKEGRLKFLQSRVSMSTVSIEFYKYTAESSVSVSYGQKMLNALKSGWNGISVFFLGLLYLWPLFLLVIIIILVIRRYIKRSKKK